MVITGMFLLHILVASLLVICSVDAFMSSPRPCFGATLTLFAKKQGRRAPSRVVDLDGPTEEDIGAEIETISPEDIPELHYDENAHPIPHQPWRRGETNGCEDPIDAEWRQMAEQIIYSAAKSVGGQVDDVTWYLTQLFISLDEDLSNVETYTTGPAIEIMSCRQGPMYFDPDDPNPADIWPDEEPEFLWERDTEREAKLKRNAFAPKDPDEEEDEDDERNSLDDNPHAPFRVARETRQDIAGFTDEEEVAIENEPISVDTDMPTLDTSAVSTIARAILEALEEAEEELNVLGRHTIVLSAPGEPGILETQRQFDEHRGENIVVQTVDPWQSNRVLRGKLLERNSMDLLINKEGRMVTIPLNFVKAVRLLNSEMD